MDKKYYAMEKDKVIRELQSDYINGLTEKEAEERIKKHGKNELPKKKRDSVFKIFFRQAMDPIVLLLIVTVVFSLLVDEVIDAVAIIFIILIDLVMGTIQEWKAEKNADSLQNLIKYKVKVIRDSQEKSIDSILLVPGDIVLLESGDKVGADLRLLDSFNLQVDESVLTGESVNIYKTDTIQDKNLILAERRNMVYAGSPVVTGRAKGIVTATSLNTEIGKIAETVTNIKETKSPLTIRMEKLSKQISGLVIVVAIIIMLILFSKNVPGKEIFLSVVALSVSAMPEGLPLALTMALTITSNQMAKKNVIVKKLNYVESLGSCTIIATDKTGTLTVNEQTAKKITLPNNQTFKISGTGYNFNGQIENNKEYENELKEISILGALNNEAGISKKNNNYSFYGDSIDIAFLVLKEKAKVNLKEYKVLKRIPYESENKYSAVFYQYDDEIYCTVKGSVEKVSEFCNKMSVNSKEIKIDKKKLSKQNDDLASLGYRVIAIANGKVKDFVNKDYYDTKDIPKLTFKGMVSFIDPIREEVKDSIKKSCEAGIKVVMITGDHPLTALSIAKDLSLVKDENEVSTGVELNEYLKQGEQIFDEYIKTKKVFARVTPMDKLNIVNSFKRMGEYVAVTGDGVNDAPAIRSANIGIAMGSGTDVAKETASMIIVDDNFKSIVSGIELGRTAYSNIRKVCYLLLSCGLAEVLFFVLSIIFNLPMPLVAIQLLWLNLVTDGLQDFALSFEKTEKGIMQEKPRNTKESIFNKTLLEEVILAGLVIGLIVFGIWSFLIKKVGMDVSLARGYIMVLMVFMQNIHVLNCRSEKQSVFNLSIKTNPLIIITIISSIILQIIVMEIPFLSNLLQAKVIPYSHMLMLMGFAIIILIVMEVYKLIKYRKN